MIAYIIKRLLSAIPVLLGISVIVFIIMALIPGDPATAILGSFATPENVEKLNRDLGLDKPIVQRYFIWLGNMLQGDFGRSFSLNKDVRDKSGRTDPLYPFVGYRAEQGRAVQRSAQPRETINEQPSKQKSSKEVIQ